MVAGEGGRAASKEGQTTGPWAQKQILIESSSTVFLAEVPLLKKIIKALK